MKQLTAFEKEAVRLALEKMFRPDGPRRKSELRKKAALVRAERIARTMGRQYVYRIDDWWYICSARAWIAGPPLSNEFHIVEIVQS